VAVSSPPHPSSYSSSLWLNAAVISTVMPTGSFSCLHCLPGLYSNKTGQIHIMGTVDKNVTDQARRSLQRSVYRSVLHSRLLSLACNLKTDLCDVLAMICDILTNMISGGRRFRLLNLWCREIFKQLWYKSILRLYCC
jgi:hypothetical protein